ncbi:hypothetical protein DL96DRAFT_1810456 [Flagelloscypha sp. PMI_526]|nr:hypothetical protein DL96DRAFT_1810456 [Flagelloscypha sp. PMI_526]
MSLLRASSWFPSVASLNVATVHRTPDLPIEIIEQIILYITHVPTLFHFLVTSQGISRTAERALYHTIDITSLRNGPMEHSVFRKFSGLLRHLLITPRHASMVYYVFGDLIEYSVKVRGISKNTHHGWSLLPSIGVPPANVKLYFDKLPPKLTQLRHWGIPRDGGTGIWKYPLSCSSKSFRELHLSSLSIYNAAQERKVYRWPTDIDELRSFISEQKDLRFLRVIPHNTSVQDRLSERDHPILKLPHDQQIEAIEGSFWLIKDVLPPTVLPRKLRFWYGHDPYAANTTVPPDFSERLRSVRVLSCCGLPNWKIQSLHPLLALLLQLPLLETLEIRIPPELDENRVLSLTSIIAKALHLGPADLQLLVVTLADSPQTIPVLLEPLLHIAFSEIPTLKVVEVGIVGSQYRKAIRGSETYSLTEVKRQDWWVYS